MSSDQPRHCMVVHSHFLEGETRVERQARALIDNGFQVDVICLRRAGESSTHDHFGARLYRLPVSRNPRRGRVGQLVEYLSFCCRAGLKISQLHSRCRYQTVQVHTPPDFLVASALLPRLRGARIILDIHDLMPEFYNARFGARTRGLPFRLLCLQERLAMRLADHVITVTDLWRDTLAARGAPARKLSVVMNVPDQTVFRRQALATTEPGESCGFRLIYHGRMVLSYGLDLLIRALPLAAPRVPGLHLTLHGAGPHASTLAELVRQLGVEKLVTLSVKAVPTDQLPRLICSAHAGVVPYRDDPFTNAILPTKLMEYVALGLPVIAARTGVIRHYFDENMVQYFTPGNVQELADCIVRLYMDPVRRDSLIRESQRFNERYNWAVIGAEYVSVVRRLAAAP